jgi:hypothetical protein
MDIDLLDLLTGLLSYLSFLLAGYTLASFVIEAYKTAAWQLQIALVAGFFLLVIGVLNFVPLEPSAGFMLGVGIALITRVVPKDEKKSDEQK